MLLRILKGLDSRYEPSVVSLSNVGEIGEKIRELGIPVDVFPMRPGLSLFAQFFHLVRHIRQLQPDVVHTWMYHADLIGGVAAKMGRAKTIAWSLHNTNLERDKTKWSTRFVVRCCALLSSWLPDRILSCSSAAIMVHAVRGYAKDKMIFIPNGIDTIRFQPRMDARVSLRKELDMPEDARLVGMIGRCDPLKNHEGFLVAAAKIHRRLPNVHFILAGKGVDPDNRALVKKVMSEGLDGVVHLLGLRNDMPRVMAALDVLVSASHGEAFPLVLGEAMACCVPCVVTDVGDSAYIVGDTGIVVERDNMNALAAATEELLHLSASELAALGCKARDRIEKHFKISQIIDRYQSFYDDLIEFWNNKNS